jgi:hypothetical protein
MQKNFEFWGNTTVPKHSWFRKNFYPVFAFQKRFLKNLKFFYFFLYFKLISFMFSDHFDVLISKIFFNVFLSKKHFENTIATTLLLHMFFSYT